MQATFRNSSFNNGYLAIRLRVSISQVAWSLYKERQLEKKSTGSATYGLLSLTSYHGVPCLYMHIYTPKVKVNITVTLTVFMGSRHYGYMYNIEMKTTTSKIRLKTLFFCVFSLVQNLVSSDNIVSISSWRGFEWRSCLDVSIKVISM